MKIYQHKETKGLYELLSTDTLHKDDYTNNWDEVYLYKCLETGKLYTRMPYNFNKNFVLVDDNGQ